MVKHIISISDIHVRNFKRMEETQEFLSKLVDYCNDFIKTHNPKETRIVIAGDLFDQKITVSNESKILISWLLKRLNKIATTYVICGNHDYLMNNSSRVCSLTPIFAMSNFDNCKYLDQELTYMSGIYEDDNIAWCLFSTFDDFNRPEIDTYKMQNPDKVLVGLIHADINGAKTDVGRVTDKGLNADFFSGLDFVISGHIHKRQEIKKNGVKIVYCGSLIQQDMGENISGHGGVIWNVEKKEWEPFDLDRGEYGFYKFVIDDITDIEEDREKILNL
jgi:DNA repair exonuclease SbcCD nuclease subunit